MSSENIPRSVEFLQEQIDEINKLLNGLPGETRFNKAFGSYYELLRELEQELIESWFLTLTEVTSKLKNAPVENMIEQADEVAHLCDKYMASKKHRALEMEATMASYQPAHVHELSN